MTNFSKSATCSINDAIKLVKELGTRLEDHAKYTSERSSAIFECIDQSFVALENIAIMLQQHEQRIKELDQFKDGVSATCMLWHPILDDMISRIKTLENKC